MPLPLIPVAIVGAVGVGLASGDQHEVAGAVPHPDAAPPSEPEIRPPPFLHIQPGPQTVRPGGDPPPADPAMTIIEAGVGKVEGVAKIAVAGAATAAAGVVASGGSVSAAAAAAAQSIGSSASSAASGAAGVVGPGIVAVADVVMVGGALFTMFGGDLEQVLGLHGGPLTPEFDATTAAGIFHGTEEANVIRQDLVDTGTKFSRMGATPINTGAVPGAGVDTLTPQQARTLGITSVATKRKALALDEAA
jgi:hypothetical protein